MLGGVAVRPASDREEEFFRACREDRRVISTPIPRPASGSPGKFFIIRDPPIPAPPPGSIKAGVNPASGAERRFVATIRTTAIEEQMQAVVKEIDAETASAPRGESPVCGDDVFGLTTHRRWSWK